MIKYINPFNTRSANGYCILLFWQLLRRIKSCSIFLEELPRLGCLIMVVGFMVEMRTENNILGEGDELFKECLHYGPFKNRL